MYQLYVLPDTRVSPTISTGLRGAVLYHHDPIMLVAKFNLVGFALCWSPTSYQINFSHVQIFLNTDVTGDDVTLGTRKRKEQRSQGS